METWFLELFKSNLVLGPSFDIKYFCEGVDMIVATDHHILLLKVLL